MDISVKVPIINADNCIGKKVRKKSDRPFKSTFKKNTVKGVIPHPKLEVECFTFEEDDSFVEVRRCELIN